MSSSLETEDTALNAAVRLLGPDRGHAMLGCDWGTRVALPGDREVCIRQAQQRILLHGPDGKMELKVCLKHKLVIERMTDPHTET